MTLLVLLYPLNEVGAHRYVGQTYVGLQVPLDRAAEMLGATRSEHPDAFLAEPLTSSVGAKSALPGELARAIDAWNAMPKAVTVPRLRGNLARLVPAYRKWKLAAGQRDYLLEQLVADVEATPFCWGWIRFPWLFGKKNGELNSEKLRGEAARGGWKDAPEPEPQRATQVGGDGFDYRKIDEAREFILGARADVRRWKRNGYIPEEWPLRDLTPEEWEAFEAWHGDRVRTVEEFRAEQRAAK